MSKSKDMPDIIWAWFFCESKQDDLIKGGWTNEPDKRETPYVPKSTLDALSAENDLLKARVAELEGVLQRIDDASNHYALTTTYSEGTLRYAHESTRNLARTALKNKDASDD